MNDRSRPQAAPETPTKKSVATVTPLTVAVRQVWVLPFIRRGAEVGPIPRYGSTGWRLLDNNDPRKVAAVCVAAECWATEMDTLEDRLHAEIAAARQVEDDEWAKVAAHVRKLGDPKTKTWPEIRDGWSA